MRGDRADAERMAVLRLGDGIAAQHAGRAGLVVDHDLLAERLAHRRRHEARHEIGGAAGRKGHDELDGTRRPFVLRPRGEWQQGGSGDK